MTDGKAVGTYFEHKFQAYLQGKFSYTKGSSAQGIDFPELHVDMKVTSAKQPQSSCPFKSARQKVYGLGYDLLVFVYNKIDDDRSRTSQLEIIHVVFIVAKRTADFQLTQAINQVLDNEGNVDDISGLLRDKNLPIEEIGVDALACEIIANRPLVGYLTISNALQWRLQYRRAIEKAGQVDGVVKIR